MFLAGIEETYFYDVYSNFNWNLEINWKIAEI